MSREQTSDRGSVDHGAVREGFSPEETNWSSGGQAENASRVRADGDGEAIQGRDHGHHDLPKEKSYLVETDEGIFRVTVPADWLITFGPMYVSTKKDANKPNYTTSVPTALRFYEGKHQRACMLNVTNFHDMSIKIEEPVVTKDGQGKALTKSTQLANAKYGWRDINA